MTWVSESGERGGGAEGLAPQRQMDGHGMTLSQAREVDVSRRMFSMHPSHDGGLGHS